ncbi:hypothetical protein B7463_g7740, partial [Scytalidium lignicola]
MASSYTPAPPESLYPDLKALEASIQAWGRANSYAFAKRDSNNHRVVFTCARFGSYQSKGKRSEVHASRQRKGSSKKCNCKMKMVATVEDSNWRLKVLEPTHNHPANPAIAHPQHRVGALSAEQKAQIVANVRVGMTNNRIIDSIALQQPDTLLKSSDITNITQKARLNDLGGKTPIQ